MTETITFREIMQHLWAGKEADLTVVTYSASRNTGGQRRKYTGAKFYLNAQTKDPPPMEGAGGGSELSDTYTYNQRIHLILPNGDLKKIYKIGIKEFNGKTVIV